MKKVYYLSSCSTCIRIIKELKIRHEFIQQDIKNEKITPEQLDEMKAMAGSYQVLFSRTALKYKSMGLKNMELTEEDYRNYILEEYTFLKRPVFIVGKQIFIGNSKSNIAALKEYLSM